MSSMIHWNEGLFLQPHHFQKLQKSLFDFGVEERKLSWVYPYGVIEMRLSQDDLENKRVRCERLRAIMPSGLVVDFPENTDLSTLDISEVFAQRSEGFKVCIAVPLWDSKRANTIDVEQNIQSKVLYRLQEVEVRDENTGQNPKPLVIRKINARLILEDEDTTDMEVIPLVRILPATGEDIGKPKQDLAFAPPCLALGGSAVLHELVRDLTSQLEASRKELVVQITRGGFSVDTLRGLKLEQMMRLRTLSHYSARLSALILAKNIAPFTIHTELSALLGELAALYPDRDLFEISPYNHNNPLPCFQEISEKIRGILKGGVAPSFIKIDFTKEEDADSKAKDKEIRKIIFSGEHFTKPDAYYIAVKTKEDPRTVTELVENSGKFKFMAKTYKDAAIRGIKLKEERVPPMELPAHNDLHYYSVVSEENGQMSPMWKKLTEDKEAFIQWTSTQESDFQITLYMTIPQDKI